jgi:hypothetical protein
MTDQPKETTPFKCVVSADLFRRRAWLHAVVALICALAWLKLARL